MNYCMEHKTLYHECCPSCHDRAHETCVPAEVVEAMKVEFDRRMTEMFEFVNHAQTCTLLTANGPCDCGHTDYMFALIDTDDWYKDPYGVNE